MIIASLVVAFIIGSLLGRLHSFIALLIVSPLLALVAATAAWASTSSGLESAFFGLCAMVLSQGGFLAGVAFDPRAGFRGASQKRDLFKSYRSASKR